MVGCAYSFVQNVTRGSLSGYKIFVRGTIQKCTNSKLWKEGKEKFRTWVVT